MKVEDIENLFDDIDDYLQCQEVNKVIAQLENQLLTNPDWQLSNRLGQIKTAYHYMLEYLVSGTEDPKRKQVYYKLVAELWVTADQIRHRLMLKYTTSTYLETCRKCKEQADANITLDVLIERLEAFSDDLSVSQLTNQHTEEINILKEHEANLDLTFNHIWTNTEWTSAEYLQASQALKSAMLIAADKCLMVSAATMSLLQCFDDKKIHFLLDALDSDEELINVRAMIGLMLTVAKHISRLRLYPELNARLELLKDNNDLCDLMVRINIQMLKTGNTLSLSNKISNEIMPEMMNSLKKMKDMPISEEEDFNPEWEKLSPKLTEELQKLQDIMMEGGDVYFMTFNNLKRFPFFNSVSNWFLPYYSQHSLVAAFTASASFDDLMTDIVMKSSGFCDSDKYSLMCLVSSLPGGNRGKIITKGFTTEENRKLIEENKEMLEEMSQTREALSNNYIHCLYRFFKIFNKRHEFHDVFDDNLEFYDMPILRSLINKPERMRDIYESLMKSKMYMEACPVIYQMKMLGYTNIIDLQKAAYCEQKCGNYEQALNFLHQVEMLGEPDQWTIRHLATCHRLKGNDKEALDYYRKTAEFQPDNLSIVYRIAQCLMRLRRYDEALEPLFRIDLSTDNDPTVCSNIAICSFHLDKYDQALRYYEKVEPDAMTIDDYFYMGNIYLLKNDKRKALEHYQKAADILKQGEKDYYLRDEIEIYEIMLKEKGVDMDEFYMLIDMIE